MFVVEDRNASAALSKDVDDLLEKLKSRVQNLTELIHGIVAVLADEGDGIHVELPAAERLSRSFDQFYAVPLAESLAQVIRGRLVVVDPHDLQVWLMMQAIL